MRENVPGYLFVLSTLSLAVILYLGYASFVLLKAVCLLCLTTYAAVIGLFLVSGAATSFPMTTLPRRASSDVRVFAGSPPGHRRCHPVFRRRRLDAGLVPAGGGRARPGRSRGAVAAGAHSGPDVGVPALVQARSRVCHWWCRPDGAKVLVVKFNDFQCPARGQLEYKPIFAKYEAEHPGQVKLVLKDYPLNRDCNDALGADHSPRGL